MRLAFTRIICIPSAAFLDIVAQTEDLRRAEGKLYRLPHVVLFAILYALDTCCRAERARLVDASHR